MPPSTTTCHSARRRRWSHQRRSWAHGPLHATSGPPPPGSAAHRNPAGGADGSPRPETTTGAPSASTSSAGTGGSNTRAGAGPGTAPGHGGERRRRVGGVVARLAPRHPAHLLDRGAAARRHRGDDRVGSEHPLHPGEGAPGAVGGRGITTPEPELAPDRGTEVVGQRACSRG